MRFSFSLRQGISLWTEDKQLTQPITLLSPVVVYISWMRKWDDEKNDWYQLCMSEEGNTCISCQPHIAWIFFRLCHNNIWKSIFLFQEMPSFVLTCRCQSCEFKSQIFKWCHFVCGNSEISSDIVIVRSRLNSRDGDIWASPYSVILSHPLCIYSTGPQAMETRVGPHPGEKGCVCSSLDVSLLFVLFFICCQPKTIFPKNGTRYWRSAVCMQRNCQFGWFFCRPHFLQVYRNGIVSSGEEEEWELIQTVLY